jgi:acid stress-induced BolA-like protein IbaG/YrbA
MTHPPSSDDATTLANIRTAIETAIDGSRVEVDGGQGHYTITVHASAFAGKSTVDSHRMVYSAIRHLMAGDSAPVHAVDSLRTVAS